MEKLLKELIAKIGTSKIKVKYGNSYKAKVKEVSSMERIIKYGEYVSADYDDDSYKSEDELKELYNKFIDAEFDELSFDKKLALVEEKANHEYQTVNGYYPSLAMYLPDAAPYNMSYCRYDADTKTINYQYKNTTRYLVPESADSYRSEKYLSKDEYLKVSQDITDPKFVDYAAKRIIKAKNPFNKWIELQGFKIKESLFKNVTVSFNEILNAAKEEGLETLVKFLEEKYAEVKEEYNAEINSKIQVLKEKIKALTEAYNANKDSIIKYKKAANTDRVSVSKGRDGKGIVKGYGKIKFFDRSIKNAPTSGYIYILEVKELDKVEIIKDFITEDEYIELSKKKNVFIIDREYSLSFFDDFIQGFKEEIEDLKSRLLP